MVFVENVADAALLLLLLLRGGAAKGDVDYAFGGVAVGVGGGVVDAGAVAGSLAIDVLGRGEHWLETVQIGGGGGDEQEECLQEAWRVFKENVTKKLVSFFVTKLLS